MKVFIGKLCYFKVHYSSPKLLSLLVSKINSPSAIVVSVSEFCIIFIEITNFKNTVHKCHSIAVTTN